MNRRQFNRLALRLLAGYGIYLALVTTVMRCDHARPGDADGTVLADTAAGTPRFHLVEDAH